MKVWKLAVAAGIVVATAGCASGLSSVEKRQYMEWEYEGVLIEEKDPTAGALLGILPGFGSFYAREPAWGIVNLLLWPISVFWDPISGHQGSRSINYAITKADLEKKHRLALRDLDSKLALDEIDQKRYVLEKNRLDGQYEVY